jgi:uncharacterized protein (TIGR00299 family) protein
MEQALGDLQFLSMRIAYLDCFSGISGDMLLGALVDAGVPFSLLERATADLNIGARLAMRKVTRGGLAGTKVDVIVEASDRHAPADEHSHPIHDHQHEHTHGHAHEHEHTHADGTVHSHEHSHQHSHQPHRSLSAILEIIDSAALSSSVKQRASRAFQLLGEAEARVHSMPIEEVHFHEVGAVDTIVDIICAAVGCDHLKVDRWLASSLNVGGGTVECAHGTLPVPAPATLALLGDAPIYAAGPPMERVTPTGAAILRMLQIEYAPMPHLRVSASGYGAGGRDTPGQPNLLRLLVGEESTGEKTAEPIAIMETVIDDSSPQLIAYVSDLLLEAGAWDVYRIPVQMKKGRTGVQMNVLCHPDRVPALRDLLFRETTTIGLHWRIENKISLAREFKEVQTEWGTVRMKVARWPSGEVANAAPEYEDCRRLAITYSVPLKEVTEQARRVFAAHEEERQ